MKAFGASNMKHNKQTYRCFCASAAYQHIDPRRSKVMNEDHRPVLDNGQVMVATMRGNAISGRPRSLLDKTDNSRRNSPLPKFSGSPTRRNPPRIVLPKSLKIDY